MILHRGLKGLGTQGFVFTKSIVSLCLVVVFSTASFARDVSFSWTPNSDNPPVDGYRLYYKVGAPGAALSDYNGTNAVGSNPSPIEITGQESALYILQNLSDTQEYSFVLTSYRGTEESSPTQAVTLAANTLVLDTRSPAFSWSANSDDPPVDGYRLYYKLGDPGAGLADYNGTDASGANPSPVEILGQNSTSYSFANLLKNEKYSFVLTSFRGTIESDPTTAIVLDSMSTLNSSPVATDLNITVDEDGLYDGQLTASDLDNDALTYSIVTNGSKGTATIINTATGAFQYTPNANEYGGDSFVFKVNDGSQDSANATVNVSITQINEPPVANGASFIIAEDTIYSGQLSGSDPDGDSLSYSLVTAGSKGSVVVTNAETGAFTYTPNPDEAGTDSFTFMVNDGTVNSANATVDVTISIVNDAPIVDAQTISLDEDTTYSGQLNGTDADGDALTYSVVTNGSKGTAAIADPASGAFTFTPNPNENGVDTFTFRVSDGVNSAEAAVSVNIAPVNDAPVVNDLSFSIIKDTVYKGQLSASDPDGDNLAYALTSNPTLGTVVIDDVVTGSFTYTPNNTKTGSDSFTFRVNDDTVDSFGTVNIAISDADSISAVFGDAPDSDYPGTLEDTYANLNTDINASSETLNLYSWSWTNPNKVANTIVIKADLAAIPSYATIVDAQLQLYQTSASGAAEYPTTVQRIIGKNPVVEDVNGYNAFNGEPWTPVPAGTTNNDIPLGLADIGATEDTVVSVIQEGYITWKITNMVQEWVNNPSANYGLLIKGEETAAETGRAFAASENQSAIIRPKLIVRYTTTPPPPQLIMIEEVK